MKFIKKYRKLVDKKIVEYKIGDKCTLKGKELKNLKDRGVVVGEIEEVTEEAEEVTEEEVK